MTTIAAVKRAEIVVPEKVREKAERNIAAGRAIAKKLAPYFRPLLHTLVWRETPGMFAALNAGIGVSAEAVCMYDPFYMAELSPREAAADQLHEVLHLWNHHAKRCGTREHRKFNRAGDRAINPPIIEIMGASCFWGGCLLPKDIGMKDGLTAEQYYAGEKDPPGGGGKSKGGAGGAPGKPDPNGKQHGLCGSGAGSPLPDGWEPQGDPGARAPKEIERAARTCSALIVDAAEGKGQGKVPAALKLAAEAHLMPPKVHWAPRLRYALRGGIATTIGAAVHRYDFPSRRQAGLGYGAGVAVLPRLRQPVPDVIIVLDTSGSMMGEPLKKACVEINGVLNALGVKATFMVCDAEVQGVAEVTCLEDAMKMLKGGGGTDFRPAFESIAKRSRTPDIILFITDGHGDYPVHAPEGPKVIWALIGDKGWGVRRPPWGDEIIEVDNQAEEGSDEL